MEKIQDIRRAGHYWPDTDCEVDNWIGVMIAIGDIHGDIALMKTIVAQFSCKRIWLGDFVDSRQNSTKDCVACLWFALELAQQGDVVLYGNHEYHYLKPRVFYTGYNQATQVAFDKAREEIIKLFKWYHWDKSKTILFTHAGLSRVVHDEVFWDNPFISRVERENLDPIFKGLASMIGRCRGGNSVYGGPLWNDWEKEFLPIPELTQVFGHTPVKRIESRGNNYNLDCLEYGEKQVLNLSEENPQIVSINTQGKELPMKHT